MLLEPPTSPTGWNHAASCDLRKFFYPLDGRWCSVVEFGEPWRCQHDPMGILQRLLFCTGSCHFNHLTFSFITFISVWITKNLVQMRNILIAKHPTEHRLKDKQPPNQTRTWTTTNQPTQLLTSRDIHQWTPQHSSWVPSPCGGINICPLGAPIVGVRSGVFSVWLRKSGCPKPFGLQIRL